MSGGMGSQRDGLSLSTVFRNVPMLRSLEVSPSFLFFSQQ
jgi:hypothetical protein